MSTFRTITLLFFLLLTSTALLTQTVAAEELSSAPVAAAEQPAQPKLRGTTVGAGAVAVIETSTTKAVSIRHAEPQQTVQQFVNAIQDVINKAIAIGQLFANPLAASQVFVCLGGLAFIGHLDTAGVSGVTCKPTLPPCVNTDLTSISGSLITTLTVQGATAAATSIGQFQTTCTPANMKTMLVDSGFCPNCRTSATSTTIGQALCTDAGLLFLLQVTCLTTTGGVSCISALIDNLIWLFNNVNTNTGTFPTLAQFQTVVCTDCFQQFAGAVGANFKAVIVQQCPTVTLKTSAAIPTLTQPTTGGRLSMALTTVLLPLALIFLVTLLSGGQL